MVKSKRLPDKVIEKEQDLPLGHGYCRKCEKIEPFYKFFKAIDLEIDSNGHMSVCKDCINELYVQSLQFYNGSIQQAILNLCRKLNVLYSEDAISSALAQIETKNSDPNKMFGMYCQKLVVLMRTDVKDTNLNLTYMDNPIVNTNEEFVSPLIIDEDVIRFWGKGFNETEYRWLEETLDDWKATHKCDTKAEETLFKYIVLKEFEIEKTNDNKKPIANLVKELQDLMKTAAVDPAKANVASSGKNMDTFSAFIKMIEEGEPAEVFGDERNAFKDFQGIEKYFEAYVLRPLKNFITGSRDFNVDGEDNLLDEDDFDSNEIESLLESDIKVQEK